MPGMYDLGPYYRTSRRAMEGQRRALGYPSLSPEQIAGERYGEVAAYAADETTRKRYADQLAIQQQQLALQGRQLRNQEKSQKAAEAGQVVSGISTGVNILDKLGVFGKQGLFNKAYTGLSNLINPSQAGTTPAINLAPSGWSNFDFSSFSPAPFTDLTAQGWTTDITPTLNWGFSFNESW